MLCKWAYRIPRNDREDDVGEDSDTNSNVAKVQVGTVVHYGSFT